MSRMETLVDHCLHNSFCYIPEDAFKKIALEYCGCREDWPDTLIEPYEVRKALRREYLSCLDCLA